MNRLLLSHVAGLRLTGGGIAARIKYGYTVHVHIALSLRAQKKKWNRGHALKPYSGPQWRTDDEKHSTFTYVQSPLYERGYRNRLQYRYSLYKYGQRGDKTIGTFAQTNGRNGGR
ncbi:hypothetical protein EVAR_42598_1 [Eumeta japonica]|uniref:Uncharacterized protein n=1 Tax=Eumeta variegata TaxID=151549 RepID=A0A4C1XME8_EUMVA|nr:hypothetical protein EVAR_42598_1 [Eumeta japonica]